MNPSLSFSGIPDGTESLALIIDDPDVPKRFCEDGLWIHWVVWNIDPEETGIGENRVPEGAIVGKGTGDRNIGRYGGPCPPDREHRYFFRLYALDTMLDLPADTGKTGLEEAMKGHILAEATLMGRYVRLSR
jgi:Raf kinase inhibitor-like YbhB/YbcL family protein